MAQPVQLPVSSIELREHQAEPRLFSQLYVSAKRIRGGIYSLVHVGAKEYVV